MAPPLFARPRIRRGHASAWLLAAVLLATAGVIVVYPAIVVAWTTATAVLNGTSEPGPAAGLLTWRSALRTFAYAGGISALGLGLAIPAAWLLRWRGAGRVWAGLIAVPLLMPAYLAFAGWGLLRAPGTELGRWIARETGRALIADKIFAVLGLALWIWPLGAFVLLGATRQVPQPALDALRQEPTGPLRRAWVVSGMMRRSLLAAWAAMGLVMLGSAIPLHVAQAPTFTIDLWKAMSLTTNAAGVWREAWPVLVTAAVGAAWISRWVVGRGSIPPEPDSAPAGPSPRWARAGTLAAWALAVLAPLILYTASIRTSEAIPLFWRTSGEAVLISLGTGLGVGGLGVLLCLAIWAGASTRTGGLPARSAVVTLAVFVFAGLVPGVLVGQAAGQAWSIPVFREPVADTSAIVVLTHLARFGLVAVLAGWWLAKLEPPEERWARELEAGGSLYGWARTRLLPNRAPVLGVGLTMAALSFHEIESTVLVQPPGIPNLAQKLLDALHYSRDEYLAAASATLLSAGTLAALLAGWLLTRPLAAKRNLGRTGASDRSSG